MEYKVPAQHLKRPISRTPYDADSTQFVDVISNLHPTADGGEPVAFFEQHSAHPNGQAFVAGSGVVKVALTQGAIDAIREGKIVEATEQDAAVSEAEQAEKARLSTAAYRANALRKFIELMGSDKGFEAIWETHLRPQATAEAIQSSYAKA